MKSSPSSLFTVTLYFSLYLLQALTVCPLVYTPTISTADAHIGGKSNLEVLTVTTWLF